MRLNSCWVCWDANYNLLGIIDSDGDLVERYEYTPYGQRTVYESAGSDDPLCMSPILESQRVKVGGIDQAYGICDVGHQGLFFDKEFGLYNNRARMLHPTIGRFLQRDPAGYESGADLYVYEQPSPLNSLDPSGKKPITGWDLEMNANAPQVKPASSQDILETGEKDYIGGMTAIGGLVYQQPKKLPTFGATGHWVQCGGPYRLPDPQAGGKLANFTFCGYAFGRHFGCKNMDVVQEVWMEYETRDMQKRNVKAAEAPYKFFDEGFEVVNGWAMVPDPTADSMTLSEGEEEVHKLSMWACCGTYDGKKIRGAHPMLSSDKGADPGKIWCCGGSVKLKVTFWANYNGKYKLDTEGLPWGDIHEGN